MRSVSRRVMEIARASFGPETKVIRKGKASKPTEFVKMVKIQEAENQIIISYEVYKERPSDSDLLVKAVEEHIERLGQTPDLVAADAAFHSSTQRAAIAEMGVKRISVPNRSAKNAAIRKTQVALGMVSVRITTLAPSRAARPSTLF